MSLFSIHNLIYIYTVYTNTNTKYTNVYLYCVNKCTYIHKHLGIYKLYCVWTGKSSWCGIIIPLKILFTSSSRFHSCILRLGTAADVFYAFQHARLTEGSRVGQTFRCGADGSTGIRARLTVGKLQQPSFEDHPASAWNCPSMACGVTLWLMFWCCHKKLSSDVLILLFFFNQLVSLFIPWPCMHVYMLLQKYPNLLFCLQKPVEFNEARFNLYTVAWIFSCLPLASFDDKKHLSEVVRACSQNGGR